MQKIETSAATLLADLERFYNPAMWHFITMNCVDTGECFEVQYFFTKYDKVEDAVCYYFFSPYEAEVPSIAELIPPAYLGEAEMVDMFEIPITGINKGLFLDKDSLQKPLRKGS